MRLQREVEKGWPRRCSSRAVTNTFASARTSRTLPEAAEYEATLDEAKSLVDAGAWRWTPEKVERFRRRAAELEAAAVSDPAHDMDAEEIVRLLESGDPADEARVYGE